MNEARPPILETILARETVRRRITFGGGSLAAIAVGLAFAKFNHSPPLSREETQLVGAGIALAVFGVFGLGWVFLTSSPALAALRDETLCWVYLRVQGGGRQFAMLGTASGARIPLRLDQDGVQFTNQEGDAIFQALFRAYPWIHVGYSPEADARFRSAPTSLAPRLPPQGIKTGTFARRKAILGALVALSLACGVGASFIAKATDPTEGELTAVVLSTKARANGIVDVRIKTMPGAEVKATGHTTWADSDGIANLVLRTSGDTDIANVSMSDGRKLSLPVTLPAH
jgi:hypothetical protein